MLDDDAIERYARQIVVPGIGASGQEALLRATVLVTGQARGAATAALYLRAAGATVLEWDGQAPLPRFHVAAVADLGGVPEAACNALAGAARPVCWYERSASGFRSGWGLPDAARDAPDPIEAITDQPEALRVALHDAAGCELAALVCASLFGWAGDGDAVAFEV